MSKNYAIGDRVEIIGARNSSFAGREGVVVNDVTQASSGMYHVRFDNAGTYAFRPDQLRAAGGDLQSKVEQAIRETLQDPDGAGSDLSQAEDPRGEWMYVEGNLDIQHLASHIISTIEEG